MSESESVVLLDERGNAVGSAPKDRTHNSDTALHLAFSVYAFDEAGRLLMSRRALSKHTWPGVWTNSFCGHPLPGEALEDAVRRRSTAELGTDAERMDLLIGAVRYRSVMENGIVENELGPVVRVLLSRPPSPSPREVESIRWVPWEEVLREANQDPTALSPWSVITVRRLGRLGPEPWKWPVVNDEELPPALRSHP